MKKSTVGPLSPACSLTHNVLDRLTVIVEHREFLGATASADSPASKHLRIIQQAAQSMVAELKGYQCELIALRKHQEEGIESMSR